MAEDPLAVPRTTGTKIRRCYIHIGTHKTGTTSLQHVLNTQRNKLIELSYLYPCTGRPANARRGQHNIAWALSRDRRFRKRYGTIDELLTEIAGVRYDVILSSEDFESCIFHPEAFASFIERLKGLNLDITLIVYFRNQVEYSRSLYLELLPFGLNVPFREFLAVLMDRGEFRWREWIFPFDYEEFFKRLQSIDHVAVVARSFDSARGALIDDFCSILGFSSTKLITGEDIRLNEPTSTATALAHYYRNCVGRWLLPSERTALSSLYQSAEIQIDMTHHSKLKLIERFANSNQRLSQVSGIPTFDNMHSEVVKPEPDKNIFMEDLFSPDLLSAVKERVNR